MLAEGGRGAKLPTQLRDCQVSKVSLDCQATAYVNEHRTNGYKTSGRNLAGGSDVTAAGAHKTGSTRGLDSHHAHGSSVPTSHQASGVTRAGPFRCRGSYVETSTRPVLRWPGDLALCSDEAQMTSTSSSSSSSVAISLGVVWCDVPPEMYRRSTHEAASSSSSPSASSPPAMARSRPG